MLIDTLKVGLSLDTSLALKSYREFEQSLKTKQKIHLSIDDDSLKAVAKQLKDTPIVAGVKLDMDAANTQLKAWSKTTTESVGAVKVDANFSAAMEELAKWQKTIKDSATTIGITLGTKDLGKQLKAIQKEISDAAPLEVTAQLKLRGLSADLKAMQKVLKDAEPLDLSVQLKLKSLSADIKAIQKSVKEADPINLAVGLRLADLTADLNAVKAMVDEVGGSIKIKAQADTSALLSELSQVGADLLPSVPVQVTTKGVSAQLNKFQADLDDWQGVDVRLNVDPAPALKQAGDLRDRLQGEQVDMPLHLKIDAIGNQLKAIQTTLDDKDVKLPATLVLKKLATQLKELTKQLGEAAPVDLPVALRIKNAATQTKELAKLLGAMDLDVQLNTAQLDNDLAALRSRIAATAVQLKAELAPLDMGEITRQLQVGLELNVADARQQIEALSLLKITPSLQFDDAGAGKFAQLMKDLGGAAIAPNIQLDDLSALTRLSEELTNISNRVLRISVEMNAPDMTTLEQTLRDLENRKAVKIEFDFSSLRELQTTVAALGTQTVSVPFSVDTSTLDKIKRDLADIGGAAVSASLALDMTSLNPLREAFTSLTDTVLRAKLVIDTTELSTLQATLKEINSTRLDPKLQIKTEDLDSLRTVLAGLGSEVVNAGFRIDVTSIESVKQVLSQLGKESITAALTIDTSAIDHIKDLIAQIKAEQLDVSFNFDYSQLTKAEKALEALQNYGIKTSFLLDDSAIQRMQNDIKAADVKLKVALEIDQAGLNTQSLFSTTDNKITARFAFDQGDVDSALAQVASVQSNLSKLSATVDLTDVNALSDKLKTLEESRLNIAVDREQLKVAFINIQDIAELAHNGASMRINAELDDSVKKAQEELDEIRNVKITTTVDRQALSAAIDLIRSQINPEDFIAKLTINTDDLDESRQRILAAQRELTAFNKELSAGLSTRAMQDATTSAIRQVRELEEERKASVKRAEVYARFEQSKTLKELKQLAKELQITPTIGTNKADYEAMLRDFLSMEDAARRVSEAWRITGMKFDDIQDEMEAKAKHVGQAIYEAENHGAADLVRFAWERTGDTFSDIQQRMMHEAERAGKRIADALEAASKDQNFKLNIDSTTAKKDLADFNNYAKLAIANDLSFTINSNKADLAEAEAQVRRLMALKREAAADEKADIQQALNLQRDIVAQLREENAAARQTARDKLVDLRDYGAAYKLLIADVERQEKELNKQNAIEDAASIARQKQRSAALIQQSKLEQQAQEARDKQRNKAILDQDALERSAQIARDKQRNDALIKQLEFEEATQTARNKQRSDALMAQAKLEQQAQDARDKQRSASLLKQLNEEAAVQKARDKQRNDAFIAQQKQIEKDQQVAFKAVIDNNSIAKLKQQLKAIEDDRRLIELHADLNDDDVKRALKQLEDKKHKITVEIQLEEDKINNPQTFMDRWKERIGKGAKGFLGDVAGEIGRNITQGLANVVTDAFSTAAQVYQAGAGLLTEGLKKSFTEYMAIESSAKSTAALLAARGDAGGSEQALNEKLFKNIQTASVDPGNLFGGKDIGELANAQARAGQSYSQISSQLLQIATGATAARADLVKFGSAYTDYVNKFTDKTLLPSEQFADSGKMLDYLTKTLTNANITTENFSKSIQYINPLKKGADAAKDAAAQLILLGQVGSKGSRTATDLNNQYKSLANGLGGTSKKAAEQRAILEQLTVTTYENGQATRASLKDLITTEDGKNIKDYSEALPQLVNAYNTSVKEIGKIKTDAMFETLLGTKGKQALANETSYTVEELKKVRDMLDNTGTAADNFATRFSESMKKGTAGAVTQLRNTTDTLYASVGKALEPVATSVVLTLNNALAKSMELGGGTVTRLLADVQAKFTAFGANQENVDRLAQAFNRVGLAISDKLLGYLDELITYLSNEANLNELVDGIGFWVETLTDAFVGVTKLITSIGILGAQIGADLKESMGGGLTLNTSTMQALESEFSKNEKRIAKLKADLSIFEEDKAALEQIKKTGSPEEIERATAAYAKATENAAKWNKELSEIQKKQQVINNQLDTAKDKTIADNAANKGSSMGTAFALLGGAFDLWNKLDINKDLLYLWKTILEPATAGAIQVVAIAIGGLGLAIKGVTTLVKLTAAIGDPAAWETLGYGIRGITESIGEGLGGALKGVQSKTIETTLSIGNSWNSWKTNSFDPMMAGTRSLYDDVMLATQSKTSEVTAAIGASWANWKTTNFDPIVTSAQTGWTNFTTGMGNAWNSFVAGIATAFNNWLTNSVYPTINAVREQWSAMTTGLSNLFNQAISNIIDGLIRLVGNIRDGVGGAFTQLSNIAANVGKSIYDNISSGFRGVQQLVTTIGDTIAKWLDPLGTVGDKLRDIGGQILDNGQQLAQQVQQSAQSFSWKGLIPGLASGGVLPGYSKTDDRLIMARSGEGIIVPEAVKLLGGARGIDRLNRMAEQGAIPGFATGGVVSSSSTSSSGGDAYDRLIRSLETLNVAVKTLNETLKGFDSRMQTVATSSAAILPKIETALQPLYPSSKPTPAPAPEITGKGVTVQRTGKFDEYGLEQLLVRVFDKTGKLAYETIANSGFKGTQGQFGAAGTTEAGKNIPLEYGKYKLGTGQDAYDISSMKSRFIPVDPTFKTKRSLIGIHLDGDRLINPGSAGCIVVGNAAAMTALENAIKNNGVSDLEFLQGTVKDLPKATASKPFTSTKLSQDAVLKWLEGGTNSLIAKVIGMAEGNRTASGALTNHAYGHTDPGNGAYNIGSFSAQGALNDGTIGGSDQRVIDRLIRPRIKELFTAATKAGVLVTPQVLLNYLDLANQAPDAATGWNNGQGFLGKLGELKGRENDVNTISALRVESFRNNQGRLETSFKSAGDLLRDQQRRMGELTKAITAFKLDGTAGVTSAITGMLNNVSTGVESIASSIPSTIDALIARLPEQLQKITRDIIDGKVSKVSSAVADLLEGISDEITFDTNIANGLRQAIPYKTYQAGTIAAQNYGVARDGGARRHAGQDFDISGNDSFASYIGGVVTHKGYDAGGYGHFIDIYNEQLKRVERIAELATMLVKVGDRIAPGQVVGRGETDTGVVHYEIRNDIQADKSGGAGFNGTEDPLKFLQRLGLVTIQGTKVIPTGKTLGSTDTGTVAQLEQRAVDRNKVAANLQRLINSGASINRAEQSVANIQESTKFDNAIAALEEQKRSIYKDKQAFKDNARITTIQTELENATEARDRAADIAKQDLAIFKQNQAIALEKERTRKNPNANLIAQLEAKQVAELKVFQDKQASAAAIKQDRIDRAQARLATQLTVDGFTQQETQITDITQLQKRIREKTINDQELQAALDRLGIAQINGAFAIVKSLDGLSGLSAEAAAKAQRQQGEIEKLLRGQGVLFEDALFNSLELEYNTYRQKTDTQLNKASAEQLEFLLQKGLLRTGSFAGGSYIKGAPGPDYTALGAVSAIPGYARTAAENAQVQNEQLALIYKTQGIEAANKASKAYKDLEVTTPGYKQSANARGKALTGLSEVPYNTPEDLQAAIAKSNANQGIVTTPDMQKTTGYMAGGYTPVIKLDLPTGVIGGDPQVDSAVRTTVQQIEKGLHDPSVLRVLLPQIIQILRTDPQMRGLVG
jgi:murein DD-endopeptidase MepM/ murein hydrolase activator NlpD